MPTIQGKELYGLDESPGIPVNGRISISEERKLVSFKQYSKILLQELIPDLRS